MSIFSDLELALNNIVAFLISFEIKLMKNSRNLNPYFWLATRGERTLRHPIYSSVFQINRIKLSAARKRTERYFNLHFFRRKTFFIVHRQDPDGHTDIFNNCSDMNENLPKLKTILGPRLFLNFWNALFNQIMWTFS